MSSDLEASTATRFNFLELLSRKRVAISATTFAALICADIARGFRPHDVLNVRDPWSVVGIVLLLAGLALRSWAAGVLEKDGVLATSGPYSLVRNPLYIGSFLMMFGVCVLIGDFINVWFILGPILGIYWLKLRDEERGLAEHFGSAWTDYARRTPRIVPRMQVSRRAFSWSYARWLFNHEYQAVAAALAGLLALGIWFRW